MKKKAAAAILGSLGIAAAVVLSGGLYANTVVEVTDITNTAVGAGVAESACETSMTIKAGLARYDASVKNFVIRDVTIGDIAPACAGLNATVVGIDGSGNPVVEGAALSSSPSFTVGLSNGITLDSVTEWRVVLQDIEGYAGTSVTPPSLSGNVVPVQPGEVEPVPTASPSPSATAPDTSASPEASPSEPPATQPELDATPVETDATQPESSATPAP